MTPRGSSKPPADEIQFFRDMSCCKSMRRAAELTCARPYHLCCAWFHVSRLAAVGNADQALRALQVFAARLLGECAWPLQDVFWVFQAAGQISALALVCAKQCTSIPGEARAAYRATLAVATSAAFLSTFDVLCEAAIGRP